MNLIESLKWRYATKKFSAQKLPEEKLDYILKAISLSASSTGLQPYRLVLVEDPEIRKQLGEGSFNAQITEASHLLVFAAFDKVTQAHIDAYMDDVAEVRSVPLEQLADFKKALVGGLLSRSDEQNFNWAARQAYIALGTALIAAADVQVDATPMEGFDAPRFDQLLGLSDQGLKSVVVLALGYRDAEKDFFAKFKKVRLPENRLVINRF